MPSEDKQPRAARRDKLEPAGSDDDNQHPEQTRRSRWLPLVITALATSSFAGFSAVFGLADIGWVWLLLGTTVLSLALFLATAVLSGTAHSQAYLWAVVVLLVIFLIGVWAYQFMARPERSTRPAATSPPAGKITLIRASRGKVHDGQYDDNARFEGIAAMVPRGSVLWLVTRENGSYYSQEAVELEHDGSWHVTGSVGFASDKPSTKYEAALVLARDAETARTLCELDIPRSLIDQHSLSRTNFTLDS